MRVSGHRTRYATLPGGITLTALDTYEWYHRTIYGDGAVAPSRVTRTMTERIVMFGNRLLYKVKLLQDMPRVPSSFRFELWCYRTFQKELIGQMLMHISRKVIAWRGVADFHQDAVFWRLSRLSADFQNLKKAED